MTTEQNILALIAQIEAAETEGEVTNILVAQLFEYVRQRINEVNTSAEIQQEATAREKEDDRLHSLLTQLGAELQQYKGQQAQAMLSMQNGLQSQLTATNSDVTALASRLNSLIGDSASEAIDNFNEIVKFLEGIEDSEDLDSILSSLSSEISTVGFRASEALSKINTWLSDWDDSLHDEMRQHTTDIEDLRQENNERKDEIRELSEADDALMEYLNQEIKTRQSIVFRMEGEAWKDVEDLATMVKTLMSKAAVENSPYVHLVHDGLIVTFKGVNGWESYQFSGSTIQEFGRTANWTEYGAASGEAGIFNVTNEVPVVGYYVLCDALNTKLSALHATYKAGVAAAGLIISFELSAGVWKTYQYVGKSVTETNWLNTDNWQDFGSLPNGSQTYIIMEETVGPPSAGSFYTLESAVVALQAFQRTSGVTYAKTGLIISYSVAENKRETKMFCGNVADFGTIGLWRDFGGSDSQVKTEDAPKEGGKEALSTGGAFEHIPTGVKVDTETQGVVKLALVNEAGNQIGDEAQFPVGTGTGGGTGTVVSMAFKDSPLYASAGGSVVLEASVRSATTSGNDELLNNIERVEIYDRDTAQLLESLTMNKASSPSIETYDFTFDMSAYFLTAQTRRFRFVAYDDSENSGSRNINVTAVDVTCTSVQTLSYTQATSVQKGGAAKTIPLYKFANNASDKGIEATTEIYLDGRWQVLGTAIVTDTYSHSISINPKDCLRTTLSHGAYPIRVHGVDVASGVVGNYLYTTIMCIEEGNNTPVVAVQWYSEKADAEARLYETVEINFAVYDPKSNSPRATVMLNDEQVSQTIAYRSQVYTYKHKVTGVKFDGSESLSFYVTCAAVSSRKAVFRVIGSLLDIEEVTTSLRFDMDFSSRSNAEADHTISNNGVRLDVSGSNYSTNGFVRDSFGTEAYGTENDPGNMALRIAEDMTGTLRYSPFNDQYIETTGMAIQMTVMKKNVADDATRLISCIQNGVGFYLDGKSFVFTTDNGATVSHTIVADIQDSTPTNIALVVEPSSISPMAGKGIVKLFFDGEEIGACYYDAGDFQNNMHATQITFNGREGDLYLYNIKAWQTYYGFEQAFNNYLLKMFNTDDMIEEYQFNSVMAPQTCENTTMNRPQASALYNNGLPYFVLCKNAATDDSESVVNGQTFKRHYPEYIEQLNGDKKTATILDVYAYFPDRPWQDFVARGATVTNQGTTSSQRPIKNVKMKLKTATVTLIHKTEEFSGEELAKYNACAANAAKKKVQVLDNSQPTNIITVKVDYSESGGANNGAMTQLFNELQRALGDDYKTPAQVANDEKKPENIINTSICSTPVAFFRTDRFSEDATSPSYGYFHAKGNWNEDKGDAKVFGFEGVSGYNSGCLSYGDFVEVVLTKKEDGVNKSSLLTLRASQYVAEKYATMDASKVYMFSEFCGPNVRFYRDNKRGSFHEVPAVDDFEETDKTLAQMNAAVQDFDLGKTYRYDGNPSATSDDGHEYHYYHYMSAGFDDTTGRFYFNTTTRQWTAQGDCLNPVECFELLKYDALDWFQGVNGVDDMLGSGDTPTWLAYFESRYPDDDDLNDLYESGQKLPYNLYKWLRFCQDCNHHLTEADGTINLGGQSVPGTKANRLAKWQRELHKEASVHSTLCYAAVTDYLAAVDQRSKNMMISFYMYMDNLIRASFQHLYDGDTILGSDNDCGLTVPVLIDPNDDEGGVYQGHDSVLFSQIGNAGPTGEYWLDDSGSKTISLAKVVADMRAVETGGIRPFSYDGLVKYWVTDRLSKWPKLVSSFDGERKYVRTATSTVNYLYALHGLSIQRLKEFIRTRFLFRDGFYQTGDLFNSVMSMRVTGTNIKIYIKAAKAGYFGVGVDRANVATDSVYLEAGETATLRTYTTNSGSGTQLYIFGADKLEELDIHEATPSAYSWDIAQLKLLRKFVIGGASYVPTNHNEGYLTTLDLGNMPFLEELDIRRTYITTVNATYCPRLITLLGNDSQLQRVVLAEASKITRLQLPSTYKNLQMRFLPNLTRSGISFQNAANIDTLVVEDCPQINGWELLTTLASASGSKLKTVRVTGVNATVNADIMTKLASMKLAGLDATMTQQSTPAIIGKCRLLSYTEEELINSWQRSFPELTVKNALYSDYVESDLETDPANITNLDNGTGYGTGKDYEPSGYILALRKRCLPVRGKYNAAKGTMVVEPISTKDYRYMPDDVESSDNGDALGVGYDFFIRVPRFWYKGVNDFKNQKKHTLLSYGHDEPEATWTVKRGGKLSTLLYRDYMGLNCNVCRVGEAMTEDAISTLASCAVYRLDVLGCKQARYIGLINATYGAVFTDANNKVLSVHPFSITGTNGSPIDFKNENGDYVFRDIPTGARWLYFTCMRGFDNLEAFAVDSTDIEAIEPGWVLHESALVGIYSVSLDDLGQARSIAGRKTRRGTGTSTTSSEWRYDSDGNPTAAPISAMNYTYKDLFNLCHMRGRGYGSIPYEESKTMAILSRCYYGNRDDQRIYGFGNSSDYTCGVRDSFGTLDTEYNKDTGVNKVFGLEGFIACVYEIMDNLGVNITTFKEWWKAYQNQVGPTDGKWHIYDPHNDTERVVQGLTSASGNNIARLKHGRYCDVVPSSVTSDTSAYSTCYGAGHWYTNSPGRVVGRSYSSALAFGGLVFAYANVASSSSLTDSGARLAFFGSIENESALGD